MRGERDSIAGNGSGLMWLGLRDFCNVRHMFGIQLLHRVTLWRLGTFAICGCAIIGCILTLSGCGGSSTSDENAVNLIGDDAGKTIRDLEVDTDVADGNGQQANAAVPRAPSVAVIDVNEVARQLGTMNMISAMVDDKEAALQQNFTSMQQRFMQQYNLAAQRIGNQPTEQQQAELQMLQQSHMNQLTAEWNRMQQETSDFHAELKKQFIDSVRPVAAAVAKSKNIPTVLTASQVFSSEDNCDITEDVAQAMQQILREASRQAESADAAAKLR